MFLVVAETEELWVEYVVNGVNEVVTMGLLLEFVFDWGVFLCWKLDSDTFISDTFFLSLSFPPTNDIVTGMMMARTTTTAIAVIIMIIFFELRSSFIFELE